MRDLPYSPRTRIAAPESSEEGGGEAEGKMFDRERCRQ
jgi:hypothetical protein